MNINKDYARQATRKLSALALLCVLAVQPTLAQSFSGAQAIGDNGLIVGGSTGTGIIFNTFLLDREGFHDLGNPVVHAFLYRDGVMHDLGTLP